jgi:uncharacterized protein DUF3568
MANLAKRLSKIITVLCLVPVLANCAVTGLAVPAAVSGSAAGVDYSITNVAHKTISYPVADVEFALHKALKKMDIKETERKAEEGKVSITAVTGDLNIYIDLEKVTPTVTSIHVNAEKGVFFKDKSTATEIIVQTEKNLEVKK